jgi:hypothetical protein
MSLQQEIANALEEAFIAADDFVINATVIKANPDGFDFGAIDNDLEIEEEVVQVIIFERKTIENTEEIYLVVRASDFDNSRYNSLVVGGDTFNPIKYELYGPAAFVRLQKEL